MINKVFRKKIVNGQPELDGNGDFVMELVSEEIVPDVALPPNWNGLRQALWTNDSLMGKALMSCATNPVNAAAIALFSDAITSGERGTGTEGGLLKAWNMISVSWNQTEKNTINDYLTQNNFTIQVT